MKSGVSVFAYFALASLLSCCSHLQDSNTTFIEATSSSLRKAESLRKSGAHADAIQAYRDHMQSRLNSSSRASWENPHFYLLIIGDIHRETESYDRALESYREAFEQKVEPSLVSDRIRTLGQTLAGEKKHRQALGALEDFVTLEPLLTDLLRDEISRDWTRFQDEQVSKEP